MALLGQAAMLLLFDVVHDAIPEHDDWHTHEHLPERLSIPGFVRGSRWVALNGQPRYFVMYEVEQLAVLTSSAYVERLNHPSPWTSKMMTSYRGMSRGFCTVTGSFGFGMGNVSLLIRLKPAAEAESALRRWLLHDVLPQLPARPGIGSVHLLEGASTPAMTNEQRIRGADSGVDWALLITGYRQDALASLMQGELDNAPLQQNGATGVIGAMYRMEYSIMRQEVSA
jgi:hypothetical protein